MSMNRATIESFLNGELGRSLPPFVDTDVLNEYRANVVKTAGIVQSIGIDEKTIGSDPATSDAGKQQKLRTLAEQSVTKFTPLGRVLAEATSSIERLTAMMLNALTERDKHKEPEATEAFQRERELRGEIGRVGANAAYLQALEHDEFETVRALLTAPGKPWVSADVRARGEEAFSARTHPDLVEKRRSVEYLRDHFAALATMISQWLVGLGANAETVAKTLNLK